MADEDHRSALTDEEDSSYGPVPPPPPDGNEVAAAQEQYDLEQNQQDDEDEEEDDDEEDEEYMDMPDKNDPPSQDQDVTMDVTADEFASSAEEDEDDMSVEIPPTSIVQRMLASEKNGEYDEDEKGTLRMGRVLGVVACCLAILAIILGAGFGTGAFTKDKSSNSSDSDPSDSSGNADGNTGGNGGGEVNNPMRSEDINLYLASVTFVPTDEFNVEGSAQQQAVNWLITEDPMQLGTDTVADQIHLSQRFALLSLYFSDPNKEWTAADGWLVDADECNWVGVTCTEQTINGETFNAVSRFDMRDNNVAAPLPADFALLESMTTLK